MITVRDIILSNGEISWLWTPTLNFHLRKGKSKNFYYEFLFLL